MWHREQLKWIAHQKWKFCHYLLKHVWVSFFCWSWKKIFWRMLVTKNYYRSQWGPSTVWLHSFFKISSSMFNRIKKFTDVWNILRVSKWWQNFHFRWTIPLRALHKPKQVYFWTLSAAKSHWRTISFKSTVFTIDCNSWVLMFIMCF